MPDAPNLKIYPPYLSLAAPCLAVALEWALPVVFLPGMGAGWLMFVGLSLMLMAGSLALWGVRSFKAAGTNVDPHKPATAFVRVGPYRFTRNPMYLGMVLLQFGLALTFSLDWALLGGFLLWLALDRLVVRAEEAYLLERFGGAYADYLAQTRRWI